MRQLSKKELFFVGLTLFSMFFGAGNLIFPPFLGQEAGVVSWTAMVGFGLSAVGFPILGVVAVAKAGGLPKLAGRVHPVFASVFTLLIYLSIGPCLAIPRTASTSFSMAVTPFVGDESLLPMLQLGYSLAFFCVALAIALRPEKLTDRLGKILCPSLLILIAVIFFGCLFFHEGSYGAAQGKYAVAPLTTGFIDGYQTMDTIAALNFGIVIALNIRAKGIQEERTLVSTIVKAGAIAGTVLLLVYSALVHIGALAGGSLGLAGNTNGAQTLTAIVGELYGKGGTIILAAIFLIACLNTCIGLISCCSEYFATIIPSVSYRSWAFFFAFVSMVISNAGLNRILAISVPVLSAIYPVAIVLILLAFLQRWIAGLRFVYPVTVGVTAVVSLLSVLQDKGVALPVIGELFTKIPLYDLGLGWIFPALVALVLGIGISLVAGGGKKR